MKQRVWPAVCLVAIASLAGCRKAEQAVPALPEGACVADAAGALRLLGTVPTCAAGDPLCRTKCGAGDGPTCLALAYATGREAGGEDESARLYRRACLLGVANACTNYAAGIWAHDHTDDDLACARRTFEKACSAKEPFACGMVGRVMLEGANPSYEKGRQYLELACADVSGFPCRVLAMHLETGRLGDYRPERIRMLLRRACAGGDPDACGDAKTAAETFQ